MKLTKIMAAAVTTVALTACSNDAQQSRVDFRCKSDDGNKIGVAKISHTGRGRMALLDENLNLPNPSFDRKVLFVKGAFNNDAAKKFVEEYCRTGEVSPTADAGIMLLDDYIRFKEDASRGAAIQRKRSGFEHSFADIENNHEVIERANFKTDKADLKAADRFIETGEFFNLDR